MTKRLRTLILLATCLGASFTPLLAAPLTPDAVRALVKDVVYNELQDRSRISYWQYHVEKQVGSETTIREQVETAQGPVFRVLANGAAPLTAEQKQQEDERLDRLLRNPGEQAKVAEQQKDDEQRLERLVQLMPDAFLYEQDGEAAPPRVRLKFRPNPDFVPPTYEARVFHSLAGTVVVDAAQKRLVDVTGVTIDRVEFGYGLLGHVEKGGKFEIRREPVTSDHWKTILVDVHVQGRIVFFKTLNKDQREVRSEFRPVALDISLSQARALLDRAAQLAATKPPTGAAKPGGF